MAKLGGKAARTNVAGGMSGSPVYYDGKLLGAISLRFSTFSPDAVAGHHAHRAHARNQRVRRGAPGQGQVGASQPRQRRQRHWQPRHRQRVGQQRGRGNRWMSRPSTHPPVLAEQIWQAVDAELPSHSYATPIETPLVFSGVPDGVLDVFGGFFRKSGLWVMQGGAVGGSGGQFRRRRGQGG